MVQTPDDNYRIATRGVDVGNRATAYRYVTASGNYTFLAAQPYLMKYTDLHGNDSVRFQVWDVRASGSLLSLGPSMVTNRPSIYEVNTTLLSGLQVAGYLSVMYNFTVTPTTHMKISASFKNSGGLASYNIVWVLVGGGYVTTSPDSPPAYANSTSTLTSAGNVTAGYLAARPTNNKVWAKIDFSDFGAADLRYGPVSLGGAILHAVVVVFPPNVATVDPSVVQSTAAGCSSPTRCSGWSGQAAFTGSVSAGDLLIAIETETNGGTSSCASLSSPSDSLGDSWSAAVTNCSSDPTNNENAEVNIYYATAKSSGSDTVTLGGTIALATGLAIYEVSGAGSSPTASTGSCSSGISCGSSYSVSSFSLPSPFFVVAGVDVAEGANPSFTAGTSYTAGPNGDTRSFTEYSTSASSPTTSPASSGTSSYDWAEAAAAFGPATVTQPISATFDPSYGGSVQTIMVSGCSPNPSAFTGNGATNNIAMSPSCSFSLSLPGGYHWTTGSSSTTCSSGACSTFSTTYQQNSVTQPVTASPTGTLAQQTVSASGCGASPATFAGDGLSHSLSAQPSCTITLYLPAAYLWTSTGSQTRSVTTCSSGTCPASSDSYYFSDAASSTQSWSKPGLSPYQGYFATLDEYVSPGNGLLGVAQMDLSIPGRGLDLSITRVFSTPYSFRTASPYVYDNYTLTNLGYGWSLDFPWLGTNYFHLVSGQAYPYQWSGNTFEYHKAVDFKLVNTGNGYTLYAMSGTVYQFDANKKLTSITDSTGNNTIYFGYGTDGYISQITDTIGRVVTFSYNANNQLASIAYAGNSWSYGYSGNNLVSMTDPLGRITTYQYNSGAPAGIASWLISAVLYPTGGKTTYAYGSAPINSQVSTYYVTAKNVYYFPTLLSQSSSISYSLLNGDPVWSNATISDAVNIQVYQDYSFQSSNSLMRLYDKSSSGALIRITEYDYDSSGRISSTKFYSPTNTLLASSQASYDDWGNLVYSKDNVGKETWYSYANTDSQNTFGTTGFSNSFYTQTISSNIHDALVGEATWQDGTGSVAQETYFEYDSAGNLLEQKQLHSGSWLLT
ncbi:MAG: RHS repeat protein, partial [Nitrososphaerota archaeon]|nr:RHS repeat protein [Nitrososphaerota archaeon]